MSNATIPRPTADFQFPVIDPIRDRRSGRAFTPQPVDDKTLGSILEAARWAASSSNEQPWSFIVATKENPEEFNRLLHCLVEFNQGWAQHAPLLLLSVARMNSSGGKPNRLALHDVGQAAANLAIQATALGLMVHQMAGFDVQKAREAFAIPDDHEPVAAIAVGYPGDPTSLPEKLREREVAPRVRHPQKEFVFTEKWGSPK
jgi:nitroreductase